MLSCGEHERARKQIGTHRDPACFRVRRQLLTLLSFVRPSSSSSTSSRSFSFRAVCLCRSTYTCMHAVIPLPWSARRAAACRLPTSRARERVTHTLARLVSRCAAVDAPSHTPSNPCRLICSSLVISLATTTCCSDPIMIISSSSSRITRAVTVRLLLTLFSQAPLSWCWQTDDSLVAVVSLLFFAVIVVAVAVQQRRTIRLLHRAPACLLLHTRAQRLASPLTSSYRALSALSALHTRPNNPTRGTQPHALSCSNSARLELVNVPSSSSPPSPPKQAREMPARRRTATIARALNQVERDTHTRTLLRADLRGSLMWWRGVFD